MGVYQALGLLGEGKGEHDGVGDRQQITEES
jgi:hypothetical protein